MKALETDLVHSHRVTLKKRYNLLLTQQTGTSPLSFQISAPSEVPKTDILFSETPAKA